jgi:hypothetical protein
MSRIYTFTGTAKEVADQLAQLRRGLGRNQFLNISSTQYGKEHVVYAEVKEK